MGKSISKNKQTKNLQKSKIHLSNPCEFYLSFTHVLSLLPGGSDGKESACNVGDLGLIPGSGRSSGEGNGNPFQYSCLENPMDGGAWWATVHGVSKSRTRLSDFTFTTSLTFLHNTALKLFCLLSSSFSLK